MNKNVLLHVLIVTSFFVSSYLLRGTIISLAVKQHYSFKQTRCLHMDAEALITYNSCQETFLFLFVDIASIYTKKSFAPAVSE